MNDDEYDETTATITERPWISLAGTYDIEAWIDQQNRNLQRLLHGSKNTSPGICFVLDAGGEIFLHTTSEGNVVLDVLPDAEWIAPLITAATGVTVSQSQIWAIPGECLTALILGLNSLIRAIKLVPNHDFGFRKY